MAIFTAAEKAEQIRLWQAALAYCATCRAAARQTDKRGDCTACEGRMPELLPENEAAFTLLQAGATQIRAGFGGFIGYDYPALKLLAEDWGVETSPGFWRKVRAVEVLMAELGRKENRRKTRA